MYAKVMLGEASFTIHEDIQHLMVTDKNTYLSVPFKMFKYVLEGKEREEFKEFFRRQRMSHGCQQYIVTEFDKDSEKECPLFVSKVLASNHVRNFASSQLVRRDEIERLKELEGDFTNTDEWLTSKENEEYTRLFKEYPEGSSFETETAHSFKYVYFTTYDKNEGRNVVHEFVTDMPVYICSDSGKTIEKINR